MKTVPPDLPQILGHVFDNVQTADNPQAHERQRQEFVFHMTDWDEELESLAKLYSNRHMSEAEATQVVVEFLYHALPHLNAAGRLLLDRIPDAFLQDKQ